MQSQGNRRGHMSRKSQKKRSLPKDAQSRNIQSYQVSKKRPVPEKVPRVVTMSGIPRTIPSPTYTRAPVLPVLPVRGHLTAEDIITPRIHQVEYRMDTILNFLFNSMPKVDHTGGFEPSYDTFYSRPLYFNSWDHEHEFNKRNLYYVTVNRSLEETENLLKRGANPNKAIHLRSNSNAFHSIVGDWKIDKVKLYFKYGADPNLRDKKDGHTPLHHLCMLRLYKRLRVNWSTSPEDVPKKLRKIAERKRKIRDLIALLVSHGADINAQDN